MTARVYAGTDRQNASVDFTWRDGERLVRFGSGALAEAPRLVGESGLGGYALLTTERAAAASPALVDGAEAILHVPRGKVDEISAELLPEGKGRPLVALGGGRVIDSAKAIAAVRGGEVAALPTTLSGAELTPFHRLPAGFESARTVRPGLVLAKPSLMTSQPPPALAATAMNALAHAVEALYVELANPVAELAALRAAELIAVALATDHPAPTELALGALLAGYAVGVTGYGVHHVVCQTIVRVAGTPHAETNAVMLPHALRLMEDRAPEPLGRLALALGSEREGASHATSRVGGLAGATGVTRLSELGVEEPLLGRIAATASARPQLDRTPDPPGEEELLALLRAAL